MEEFEEEMKHFIIETLDLEEVQPSDIGSEAPLFGEGLGLDSIDALELGVALTKKYQVEFDENASETHQHFSSVRSLASFVKESQNRS